jgi:hypothetical protein
MVLVMMIDELPTFYLFYLYFLVDFKILIFVYLYLYFYVSSTLI